MVKLKKTLFVLVFAAMVLSLAACSNTQTSATPQPAADATPPAAEQTPAPVSTDAPVATPQDSLLPGEDAGPPQKVFGLNEWEQTAMETLGPKATEITDETFASTINGFLEDPSSCDGQIYILEGVYTVEDDVPYISRTMPDGSPCRLPLKYLEKAVEEGAWIRLMGIFSFDTLRDETCCLIQTVTVEGLETPGQVQLPG